MPDPFLSSEEYDERAHEQYDRGDYDAALETLKEGLHLYPHSVDLHVGLGYTRLAREEYAWAKQAFEKALVLDGEHEDALVGYGESLLRFGRSAEALSLFRRVRRSGAGDDPEILLTIGRALYREGHLDEARGVFEDAAGLYPENTEAAAALGYVLHRLGEDGEAVAELRRALSLDPGHHEARVFLGHLLYDRADWSGARKEFEAVPPSEQWDPLAVWRLIELRRAAGSVSDEALAVWEARLSELEDGTDPIDDLLAEIEAMNDEPPELDVTAYGHDGAIHRVRMPDDAVLEGTWAEIVRQIRDREGGRGESIAHFMRRRAQDARVRTGIGVPAHDPEAFVLAHARAGLLQIER
ncbi:MAG TPA: tetratricopeptide repeat protein [Longimicrobiales bacterium]|nr:tetratricopeptide repeat protein [Longimicrobiales bacterium]